MSKKRPKKSKAHTQQKALSAEKERLQNTFNHKELSVTEKAAQDFIKHYPNDSFGYKTLGVVQQSKGHLSAAITTLKHSLVLAPKDSETYCNLGNAQQESGLLEEAETNYLQAIKLTPKNYLALTNLGGLYKNSKRYQEADHYTRLAIKTNPEHVSAYMTLGAILKDTGKLLEAEKTTRHALKLTPKHSGVLLNLGAILQQLGRLNEAKEYSEQALLYQPENINALRNFGIIQKDLYQFEEAIETIHKILKIQPDYTDAWIQLSDCLKELGQNTKSIAAMQKAIELEPEDPVIKIRHTLLALPFVSDSTDEVEQSLKEFAYRTNKVKKWINETPSRIRKFGEDVGTVYPFYLAYRKGNHRKTLSDYGDLLSLPFKETNKTFVSQKNKHTKIRLLIICAYIRRHPVWDVILKGLVQHIDRSRFELIVYHLGKTHDKETDSVKKTADIWRDGSTDQGCRPTDWLAAVSQDQPDVIYYPEIGMSTAIGFMASHRLASLQITSWGHPITTGLKTIDLFLSGELIESKNADNHYREKLIRLPGTGCCAEIFDIKPQPSVKLESFLAKLTPPVFVIPQNHFKFAPENDEIFVQIAERMGDCTFLFPEPNHRKWALQQVLQRIGRVFLAQGLDPDRYLKTFPWLNSNRFSTLLDHCQVFLDCPGFSGYTTAWQALHRGLPIVTLEGDLMRQRLASGLLRQIGITETIAHNTRSYVDIAVSLAQESLNTEQYSKRRRNLKSAIIKADNRTEVIRAFEETIITELSSRNTLPERFSELTQNPKPLIETMEPDTPPKKTAYPWQKLDADLHLHSLSHDYAPVGLLRMINKPPKNVLDVGCFCGGSGRWIKDQFPDAHVTGIEMLEKAAEIARQSYDEVHTGKFEEIDTQPWSGKFDTIITADVLEHMYNPWAVLQQLKPLLAPGGAIYISLPNIRNLNILAGLASGEWNYAEAGILDITHIRFFTKQQALEMLEQTGWQTSHININPDTNVSAHFQEKDLKTISTITAGKLKLDNINEEDVLELMALQFYIRAVPK